MQLESNAPNFSLTANSFEFWEITGPSPKIFGPTGDPLHIPERLHPTDERKDFLMRAGVPEEHAQSLLPLLSRHGKAETFIRIAEARIYGTSWERIPSLTSDFISTDYPPHEKLSFTYDEIEQPQYRYHARLRRSWEAISLREIPCQAEFFAASARIFSEQAGDRNYFCMSVPQSELTGTLALPRLKASDALLERYFAYLEFRYYEADNSYVICELRSPALEHQVWDEHIQDQYSAWNLSSLRRHVPLPRLLLDAFEDYIRCTHQGPARPDLVIPDYEHITHPKIRGIVAAKSRER